MKTQAASIKIESPTPQLFTLTPQQCEMVRAMHTAWIEHLRECDELTPDSIRRRHAEIHAAVRQERTPENIEKFNQLPEIDVAIKRGREVQNIATEALNITYKNKWRQKLVSAVLDIAKQTQSWLEGYGEEMRPRFEACGLPFQPIKSGPPWDHACSIIRACQKFAQEPEENFTQLTDLVTLNLHSIEEAAP